MIDAIKNSMPLLFEESMPVWMTLVIGLIAAVGSYFLAPAINRKLEIDKQRSQHVANAIKSLNENFIELSFGIKRFVSSLSDGKKNSIEVRSACLEKISEMQWKIVDVKVILKKKDLPLAEQLGKKLNILGNNIKGIKSLGDEDKLDGSLREVSETVQSILDRLYRHARLK